jgi:hypothetical protein
MFRNKRTSTLFAMAERCGQMICRISGSTILLCLSSLPLYAAVPLLINVQGRLSDTNGNPITVATQVEFRLYLGGSALQADAGTLIYDEVNTIIPASDGTYSYIFGSGSVLNGSQLNPSIFDTTQPAFLQMDIAGQALLPRLQIVAVPYALESAAVVPGSITSASIAAGGVATNNIAAGAVTTTQLSTGAVTEANLDATTLSYLVPSGLIGVFAQDCPSGWTRFSALDNFFPMGGSSYGATGGSATHTHTISMDGAHNHGGSTGQSTVNDDNQWLFGDYQGSGSHSDNLADATHVHSISTDGAHNHGGATGPASSLPPYMTVVFCQKQ